MNRLLGIDSASLEEARSNRVVVPARQDGNQFLGSLKKGSQIRAQVGWLDDDLIKGPP
jgi:hypothetical protein